MIPSAVPAGAVEGPLAGTGVPAQRRRVTGAGDAVGAGHQVDAQVHGGRERLVGVLAQQEGVGGVEERRLVHRAEQPAQGTGEVQRLGAGGDTLAADVDQHHLQVPLVLAEVGDQEVAGVADAVGGDHRGLGVPPGGQRRDLALGLQAVAQVGEHRLAQRGGQPAALAAGLEEDEARAEHRRRGRNRCVARLAVVQHPAAGRERRQPPAATGPGTAA